MGRGTLGDIWMRLWIAAVAVGALLATPALADEVGDAIAACDALTASPFDPGRRADGLSLGQIDVEAALPVCTHALELSPDDPRLHFQLGRIYEASQQFDLAWEAYLKGAEMGLPISMRGIARMAFIGLGRPVEIETALKWYRAAADEGLVTAQWEYALALLSDYVAEKDYETAIKYYEYGAFGGAPEAMRELGRLYEHGQGVPRDYAKAEEWYLKAAERGHVPTMIDLGIFYGYAEGKEPDWEKCRLWFERALDAGNADAPHNLALLYENGRGVPEDDAKAIELYKVAIDRGSITSLHNLGVLLFATDGPEHDSSAAAFWLYQSLLRETQLTFEVITDDPDYWDDEFRKALQELMTKDGFYTGPINGKLDEATIAALRITLGPRN